MTGYHEVRVFWLEKDHRTLPEGWKPFSAVMTPTGGIHVVARKWHRERPEHTA